MEEQVTMATRDLDRLKVIHQVLAHKLTWPQAAAQLALSVRQIGRLCVRVRREGHAGIVHRLRGRPSNRRVPPERLTRALALIQRHYPDFGPTFAAEKLRARHRVTLSIETLRQGMILAGLWRPRRPRVRHRAWRPRRACVGELVQLDGSDPAWFEERGPRGVLLAYVDDATSRWLYGAFVASEDTDTLFRATVTDLQRPGRPVAFYVDKDAVYRVHRPATIAEPLQETGPRTQLTRAMRERAIDVIFAHSPQAKGRVERAFDTHQDRLVKELRLAGIATIEAANRFLQQTYLPAHTRRFAVEPANSTNAHRPLRSTHDLAAICALQTVRQLERDVTVRVQNWFFQRLSEQPVRVRPRDPILIEQQLDGSIHLRATGRYVAIQAIPKPLPHARGPRRLGSPGVGRGGFPSRPRRIPSRRLRTRRCCGGRVMHKVRVFHPSPRPPSRRLQRQPHDSSTWDKP